MSVTPVWRSPFTDLTACLLNHQHYGKCAQFEMNMVECYEAYGVHVGKTRCQDLVDDFRECTLLNKQTFRIFVSIKYNLF